VYNKTVVEHYRNPRNVGEIEDADGVGIYMSDFCGDITKFWIKIVDGKITDVKYKTMGCAASIASGSVLTEIVKGKTVEDALKITKDDISNALNGLPEQKIHCSVLADDALKDAIRDYLSKKGLPVPQELVEKHEKMKPLIEKLEKEGCIII
jgi:nitrogen fixation NifU-like protein